MSAAGKKATQKRKHATIKAKGVKRSMEILIAAITTAGAVAVALIQNRRKTAEQAEANTQKILGAIADVKKELNANSRATVATTRGLISNAYWQYKPTKKIPEQVMHNIMDLYEAYKGIQVDGHTPNSWCDALVDEMKTWETT